MLGARWLALPKLVRFMVVHFADGVALGWACGLLLIRMDFARIGSLLASSDTGWLTALIFVQIGLLFGTVHMSVALMNMNEDE